MLGYLAAMETESDRTKFETIYLAYRGLMYHVAYYILKNPQDAEDVVHQSFVKLAERMADIPDGPCPRTRNLVVTVTERGAIDLYRSRQRHPEAELDEQALVSQPAPPTGGGLADAMASLPPRYREVLLLKYYNGYSAREIAGFLSATPDAVTQTLHRARKKLAEILEERAEKFLSALPDQAECVHDFSPDFETRMELLLHRQRRRRPWRALLAAAAVIGALAAGLSVGARDRTNCQIYWSQTNGELRYVVRLEHVTTQPFQDAQLDYVPEGFTLVRGGTNEIRGERSRIYRKGGLFHSAPDPGGGPGGLQRDRLPGLRGGDQRPSGPSGGGDGQYRKRPAVDGRPLHLRSLWKGPVRRGTAEDRRRRDLVTRKEGAR